MASPLLTVSFLITILIPTVGQLRPWPSSLPNELQALNLSTDTSDTDTVATDYGRLSHSPPSAVLHPSSPSDIAALIHFSYSSPTPFTISARGHGHSIHGQALASGGVVIDMSSLSHGLRIKVALNYVDAGGEQLWIDVLHETLNHGLAPRAWTDYLYLSVGGTLSNAGISGQAFRHGPQISNVFEMDVITGKGEMVTCSDSHNSDLFFAVLGGLGQFGVITRARIALEPAPKRVRWVRMVYTDFEEFARDQEELVGLKQGFHYVEGSVLVVEEGAVGSWRSSTFFSDRDVERIRALASDQPDDGPVYCLEATLYYDPAAGSLVDQELTLLLEGLHFVPGFAFTNDVSYFAFLNRVRDGELKLRDMGFWDVPHPWLNMFVPKSRMLDFDRGVFKGILKHNKSMGPILIYPMTRHKWDERMSAVIPDEEVFYSVGILRSAVMHDWRYLEEQNGEIFKFCNQNGIRVKQYLPHYSSQADWMKHFGSKWDNFVAMKLKYDPKALLSSGQGIFTTLLLLHDNVWL